MVLTALLLVALSIGVLRWGAIDGRDNSRLALEQPSLVALAATDGQEGVNFLQQEAGISAYVKVDQAIDIPRLRAAFKVVEQLSDTYLTGQIAIPDLEENWHPRVFVTQDGWIVAYYPHHEPTSKMLATWIRSANTTLTGTPLELAIRETLRSVRISPLPTIMEGIRYYHFQHPTANRIMLIREDTNGDDFFYLTIPSGLGILDATWIAYDNISGSSGMWIDGNTITSEYEDFGIRFGDLLPRLKPDTRHTIFVRRGSYGVVLLYQAP